MRPGRRWIGHSLRATKGIEDQFHSAGYTRFVENPKQIVPHGVFAQVELKGNLLVPHIVEALLTILKWEPTVEIPTSITSRPAKANEKRAQSESVRPPIDPER